MSAYRMSDGVVVNTDNATDHWSEDTYFDGRNNVSRVTGKEFCHQTLYRSRKGRYYIVHWDQYQGSHASAEWISNEEACAWLVLNDYELPAELEPLAEQVQE